jgi:cysteine desulfurase
MDYLEKKEGFEITRLPVSRDGFVNPDDLKRALRPDTTLVSIMAANNEVGSIQPVAALGSLCQSQGVLFHTDAVQWIGKEPFTNIHQFNADLVSICAHKFHGPKGAGVLYIKSPLLPDPILFGGGHENERRAGTENLPAIIGLTEAMERFVRVPVFDRIRLESMIGRLTTCVVKLPGVQVVNPKTHCLANTLSFVVEGSDSIALIAGLDLEGICASSGSACTAGSLEPSHVILALGYEPKLANALVRFSLGRENTEEDVNFAVNSLPKILSRSLFAR